jgi:hypothetical protein
MWASTARRKRSADICADTEEEGRGRRELVLEDPFGAGAEEEEGLGWAGEEDEDLPRLDE